MERNSNNINYWWKKKLEDLSYKFWTTQFGQVNMPYKILRNRSITVQFQKIRLVICRFFCVTEMGVLNVMKIVSYIYFIYIYIFYMYYICIIYIYIYIYMLILLLWDLSTVCVVDHLWPLILCSLLSLLSTLWFIGISNV